MIGVNLSRLSLGAAMLAMALLASGCAMTPHERLRAESKQRFENDLAKAQQGDAHAQASVSAHYKVFLKDEKKSLYWLRKAAEGGNGSAQHGLGQRYLDGRGVKRDEKKALYWLGKAADWLHKTAERGELGGFRARFYYSLSLIYSNGSGVKRDEKKSLYWLHKAADHDKNFVAKIELAALYEYGKRVKRDLRKAADLYQKGIDSILYQKDINSMLSSGYPGVYYTKNMQESRNALSRVFKKMRLANKIAITKGDKKALRDLIKLASGQGEMAKASKAMLEELLQSGAFIVAEEFANQGKAEAQFMLGENYRLGKGVKKNVGLAIFWYKKAAEQGLLKAEGAIAKLAN